MSLESTPSSSSQTPVFKNRLDVTLQRDKPLQSTLSHSDHFPAPKHPIASPSKDRHPHHHHQLRPSSRQRTLSASEDTSGDTVAELSSIPSYLNKRNSRHDRRNSELKSPLDQNDRTGTERRYSTPQISLSALIPQALRNAKHHHKTNTKDDTHTSHIAMSNLNASTATPSIHAADVTTMKTDPSILSKISTTTNGSRLISSHSSERLASSSRTEDSASSSFIFEPYPTEPRSTDSFISESRTPLCVSKIYHEYFYDYFHINYTGEFEDEGPFLASLRYIYHKTNLTDTCVARAIVRTSKRNCDISETVNEANEKTILEVLFHKENLPVVHNYTAIGDPKANERIYLFDKINDERYNCKIGVIYQGSDQTKEYDIFCNDSLSSEMRDFLNHISNRISLKGFPKYRGDLDTKDNLHGEFSYYTEYENHEIMFNISPMIPSTKANGQCIERKGLIGNAFVCVVFQEQGAVFSPDFISGKVTQIYITVQPTTINGQLYYKVGIWRRYDITSIIDPPGGVYKYDQSFCSYFLTLILNSINVASDSPKLRSRIVEQRQRLKWEELKKLVQLFSVDPIQEYITELDHIHQHMDMRYSARSESFAGTPSIPTSDSTSTTSGRVSPVSAKKKGFSKKLFGVFTSRSGSVTSGSGSPHTIYNDGAPLSPQSSSTPDATMTSGRTTVPVSKESVKRSPSMKANQAPVRPLQLTNSPLSQSVSIQPSTPSAIVLNPFASDNLTNNNLLNTAALNIEPRNRSNTSPEDSANAAKAQSVPVSKIDEENPSNSTTDDDGSKEESTDDEKSLTGPVS